MTWKKFGPIFPCCNRWSTESRWSYLDNGATSQKPQAVIDEIVRYYTTENANVHRGVHTLSQNATEDYENARAKLRGLLNAADDHEIIYTSGTTQSINIVAQSYGRQNIGEGDEIIVSNMEHHSNIVPWQMLCEEKGAGAARGSH